MIGFLCCSTLPYYDFAAKQNKFKIRPVLIIGRADAGDYNVLPVSRVTNKQFIHPIYDIPIDPAVYPATKLNNYSYIRAHKQTIINQASITLQLCDLKNTYPELYLQIITQWDDFNQNILNESL